MGKRGRQGQGSYDRGSFYFYRDPDFGYVAYYRLGAPGKPTDHVPIWEDFQRRSCYRAVSKDGDNWKKDDLMMLTRGRARSPR